MPYEIKRSDCSNCDLCLKCDTADKATYGLEAVFPFKENGKKGFGNTQHTGRRYYQNPRFLSLEDVQFVPELFNGRVKKRDELGREPIYADVELQTKLGGFEVEVPFAIAGMGSTNIANVRGKYISEGAARSGIVVVIGENVMNMWGYDDNDRVRNDQPTLKDRIMSFLNYANGEGGVVIQQNVEDTKAGVWERVYNDPDIKPFIQQGLVGFEAKGGQGAKPGMGGEVKVDREQAKRLNKMKVYHFPVDPEQVEQEAYQRHSVPGTLTPESLTTLFRETKQNYPDVRLWFKTGPYKDIKQQIEIAIANGVDAVTVDGSEGGTGMSPILTMDYMGWPTLKCLKEISKRGGNRTDLIIAGGLLNGADIIKSIALGANGAASARLFVIASRAGEEKFGDGARGIVNFIDAIKIEMDHTISSLGEYTLDGLSKDNVEALDERVANMFGINYIYSPE